MPDALPTAAARIDGRALSVVTTSTAATPTQMPPAISQLRPEASLVPPVGLASTRKAISPAVVSTAPAISRRLTTWAVSQTPSGSANTTLVTWMGWTMISRPRPSAVAWRANPTSSIPTPSSHTGRWASRARKSARIPASLPSSVAPFSCSTVPRA